MTAPSEPPLMPHDADGIGKLDKKLPRWWVWLFILTTVWAVGHLIYFYVGRIGRSSAESYAAEMEAAGTALPDFDASALSPSTDPHVIGRGQALFLRDAPRRNRGHHAAHHRRAAARRHHPIRSRTRRTPGTSVAGLTTNLECQPNTVRRNVALAKRLPR